MDESSSPLLFPIIANGIMLCIICPPIPWRLFLNLMKRIQDLSAVLWFDILRVFRLTFDDSSHELKEMVLFLLRSITPDIGEGSRRLKIFGH